MTELLQHPGLILMLGAPLLGLLSDRLRASAAVVLPVLALIVFLQLPREFSLNYSLFAYELRPIFIDGLSWIFSLIFLIAAVLVAIYSWHGNNRLEQISIPLYAGSAIAAVMAGDLLTLFICWEISALSSTLIIWANRSRYSRSAGMRYLFIQVLSGLLLLLGTLLHFQDTQSLLFTAFALDSLAHWLIFFAFGIKCAFPLLHNWLQDAYPHASASGTVALSAFTTKLAVYCLARAFAGTEYLLWIGAVMTAFPIFFAVIENDLRRVLSYSLNNQLGFMVVGIGIGTPLALNGTDAHDLCHILYKALLFMSMGAVLHRIGTTKASELGGLAKSMPWTAAFCIIGAASISAVPLFSGFVSKGIILFAVAEEGYWLLWLVLLFASAGVLDHSGIKVPFFSFFAHDQGLRCQEAPKNMLLAMGITAAACIGIGVAPDLLYALLPNSMEFHPYTWDHTITQLQLLFFAGLGFVLLYVNGWYPAEIRALNLDSDWFYRKPLRSLAGVGLKAFNSSSTGWQNLRSQTARKLVDIAYHSNGPRSQLARGITVSSMVLIVSILLSCTLLFYYL
jgi:multicomponent Na+:H+ antiporter subunit D